MKPRTPKIMMRFDQAGTGYVGELPARKGSQDGASLYISAELIEDVINEWPADGQPLSLADAIRELLVLA